VGLVFTHGGFSVLNAVLALVLAIAASAVIAAFVGWLSVYRGASPFFATVISLVLPIVLARLLSGGASGPVPARALPAIKLSTSPSSVGFWIAGITHLQPHRIARLGIAYAVQEQALFADLSIRDNLQLGLVKESVFDERLSEIEPVFPVFKTRLKQYAGTLSGGEQKMLLVARSLTMRPSIILLDEIS
jgi:ABC transporter